MQHSPAGLMTALVPVFGLGFLLLCASGSIRPCALSHAGGLLSDTPTDDYTFAPASVNPIRVRMLEIGYGHYRHCLARSRAGGTGAERAFRFECLRDSVDDYNSVVRGTNPSAFRSCRLPRHLSVRG